MSRSTRTTTAPSQRKQPFCKVCFDANKPEREYTSHWVRSIPDKSGKSVVTCPVLLANNCNYCRKQGHTVKYCSVLKNDKRTKPETTSSKTQTKTKPATVSSFATLWFDSEDEEEIATKVQKNELSGWAAIAAKPPCVKEKPPVFVTLTKKTIRAPEPTPAPVAEVKPRFAWTPFRPTCRWADLSDDEEEDMDIDEEEEKEEEDEEDDDDMDREERYNHFRSNYLDDNTW